MPFVECWPKYPLVHVYITMERSTIFNSKLLVYQRVSTFCGTDSYNRLFVSLWRSMLGSRRSSWKSLHFTTKTDVTKHTQRRYSISINGCFKIKDQGPGTVQQLWLKKIRQEISSGCPILIHLYPSVIKHGVLENGPFILSGKLTKLWKDPPCSVGK